MGGPRISPVTLASMVVIGCSVLFVSLAIAKLDSVPLRLTQPQLLHPKPVRALEKAREETGDFDDQDGARDEKAMLFHNMSSSTRRVELKSPDSGFSEADWKRINPVAQFQTIRRDFEHIGLHAHLEQIPIEKSMEAAEVYTAWDRKRWKQINRTKAGFRIANGKDVKDIKEIWVWGERHSCTSLLQSVLTKAFSKTLDCGRDECVVAGRPWKHEFVRRMNKEREHQILSIFITKDPYGWLRSMQVKPYHSGLHRGLPFEDLLTTEWAGFTEYGRIQKLIFAKYLESSNKARKVRHPPLGPRPTPELEECAVNGTRDASGQEECRYQGARYKCTLAPGFRLTFGNEPSPAAGCLNGRRSRANCRTRFLCKVGAQLPWHATDVEPWIRTVEDRVQKTLSDHSSDRCYVLEDGKLKPRKCVFQNPQGYVYGCTVIPGQLQEHITDRVPYEFCLDGKHSWGVCDAGGFLCDVKSPKYVNQPGGRATMDDWKQLVEDEKFVARRAFLQAREAIPMVGEWSRTEVYNDRDPDTGHRFPNILALRTAKLRDWMQESEAFSFSGHVQCKDLVRDEAAFLKQLEATFGLRGQTVSLDNECVFDSGKCQGQGSGADKTIETLQSTYLKYYTPSTLWLANAWLDPEVEAYFGYSLLDPNALPPPAE